MGPEMMQELRDQAERFGTRFITDDATRVELTDGGVQTVWIGDEAHRAKAVVLAIGAQHKKLGIARRGRCCPAAASPTARRATPPSSRSTTR